MSLPQVRALRLSLAVTASIAFSYGVAWPMAYMVPLFVAMFLSMPLPWMGWPMAFKVIKRLWVGLLIGLVISEFFLRFPLVCVPFYGLFFFYVFFNDAKAPPLSTIFMMIGATMVPIIGLQATVASHYVAMFILFDLLVGFFITWFFHWLLPNGMARVDPNAAKPQQPAPKPIPPREERARLALVSTLVSTTAVLLFFSLNLVQYSLAMMYICMMAGAPSTHASLKVMTNNSKSCFIGGVAIIVAYNLLVAVPSYWFLLILSLAFCLFFAQKINSGKANAAIWSSGFTTFLVLLGSSTGVDSSAGSSFYLRIAQVIFAGLFCILSIVVIEHWMQRRGRRRSWRLLSKPTVG
ncbi:hypothetical protein ACFPK9_06105 [Rubritalea spongiae]|uniref:DUF2955 domain-containing protein n=1 Tax=Rubritalea spongiae TaxID=430797 RepID=A0ABW5E6I0_9BACT